MYQFGHEFHAVRVGRNDEQDHVVQNPHRLGVGPAGHLVSEVEQVLRRHALGGVQAAVDPDDRLAFGRELPRLVVGQPLGVSQAL